MFDGCHGAAFNAHRQAVGLSQTAANFFSDDTRLFCGLGSVVAKLAQHHNKLVTTESRYGIGLAHTLRQPLGRFNQQQVANGVPIPVVERFEVIQIEKHQRPKTPRASAGNKGLVQAVVEQSSIGQLGQWVVEGQLAHLVFHLFALGDVLNRAMQGQRNTATVAFHSGQSVHPALDTVMVANDPNHIVQCQLFAFQSRFKGRHHSAQIFRMDQRAPAL